MIYRSVAEVCLCDNISSKYGAKKYPSSRKIEQTDPYFAFSTKYAMVIYYGTANHSP
jgi:hypothetical protein